jgi:hypothetical protein
MWRVNWPRLHNITSRKCKGDKVSLLKRLDTLALSLRFHLLFLSSISLSASESSNPASNCIELLPIRRGLSFPFDFRRFDPRGLALYISYSARLATQAHPSIEISRTASSLAFSRSPTPLLQTLLHLDSLPVPSNAVLVNYNLVLPS